jgi:hypothetical protein
MPKVRTRQHCTYNRVRSDCGDKSHGETPCPSSARCVNCSEHPSSNKKCPKYLEEKAIQELKVKEGLSFPDARKRILESAKNTRQQLYASVVRQSSHGVDVST